MLPGLFFDCNALDSLLEVIQIDMQDTTEKNNILHVGDKQYGFKGSTLFTYDIYVEVKQATNKERSDIVEFVTNGDWIAIKQTTKGCKATKVHCMEFVNELMGSPDDTSVVRPPPNPTTKTKRVSASSKHIKGKGMLKKISNLLKRASNLNRWC